MDTNKTETIFDKVLADLNGRDSRKVANNTYLQKRDADSIALKYHATDVVMYYRDGRVVMDTGGWRTSTTKLRFNESYARLPVRVWADRGVWYVNEIMTHWTWDNAVMFADGLTLQLNGDGRYHVDMSTAGEDPKATQKLRRKVKAYAVRFISELRAGNVPPPSGGDCLMCACRTVVGNLPFGEASKDRSHIMSHIEEGYFVPSLLVRAMEVMPCSQVMKWSVAAKWQGDSAQEWPDFVWQSLQKILARYVLRQLGEVS